MKHLLLLGSGGRLGAALARGLGKKYRVTGLNHAQLDLGSPEAIQSALEGLEFDALINCAALTNVDYCETHPEEAAQVNAHAVAQIGAICAKKKARMVHISTDYVFDGAKEGLYTEEDPAEPISVYGHSKRLGELLLLEKNPAALSARVSWVFGPDRPSFLDAILRRALESDQVAAVADKYSSPTYTLDLVNWLEPLLDRHRDLCGYLHLCNSGGCSWKEYGELAIRCAIEHGVPMKTDTVAPLKLESMSNFVAKRPRFTVLSTAKFTRETGIEPRPWQEAVREHVLASFKG
jgi:dTDP-4-dehydrorhamnose reductase